MKKTVCWLCLPALLFLTGATTAPTFRTLEQMKHTRWTADNGAPAGIQALAQTTDGFLWIGSITGLYRFDGRRFERVAMVGPETSVTALAATRDGRLFIGLLNGHVLVRRGAQQADVTPSSRAKRIEEMVEDRGGGLWVRSAAPDLQVLRLYHGRWTQFDAQLSGKYALALLLAHDGSFWVLTQKAVYVLRSGQDRFSYIAPNPGNMFTSLVEDKRGTLWAATNSHGRGLTAIAKASGADIIPIQSAAGESVLRVIADRSGDVWGSTQAHGVFRVGEPGAGRSSSATVEHYTSMQGLSSDAVRAIFEDHEGSIWIGTSGGLDRFRPANVVLETAVSTRSALGYALFADHEGTIYVADSETLYKAEPGGSPKAVLQHLKNPMGICEGAGGDIWVGDLDTFHVQHDGRFHDAIPPADRGYMHCEADRDGQPWFLSTWGNLFRRTSGGWAQAPTSKSHTFVTRFSFDAQGRPALFYENQGLMRQDASAPSMIWPFNQIPGGRTGPIYRSSDDMLVGGVNGLARIRGRRIDLLGSAYPWLQHVTGIVETPSGDTWLQSTSGILRLRTADIQRAFDHPGTVLRPQIFNALDGLQGFNYLDYADNGAAVGGDGRIWFMTTSGIVWIDPANLHHNDLPPPVAITRLVADGVVTSDPAAIALRRGTKNLELDFTALSLAVPERVALRYRLEGVDEHWVDPGARRQAFYSNLAPGSYRFAVIAANEDGVWNRAGAAIRFTLPPTFVQSFVFKLLCAGAALLLAWLFYRIRLNNITRRLKARLDARLAERERIARELHDTLLQGVQGLILRFQGIADRLPSDQVPGQLMETALDRAEELLLEGRERVHGLRSVMRTGDLSSSLLEVADNLDAAAGLSVVVREEGTARTIDPTVQEELTAIASEALSNVVRHAQADAVDVVIDYGRARLTLAIVDDGRGINLGRVAPDDNRHFGIAGMHERARRVAGSLYLGANAGRRGTCVTVTVPASVAYPSSPLRRIRSLFGLSNMEALA
ncbi:sensor histidine kinase [Sphingomonas nostoxanthinifaciens]|uniref:sensor histidine kinase n=1 Tax=Sphingomonas nostoxanthinifaciens TaxID=2872652 RepID=UPI001CC1CE69|nr:sensor histidine kinase [Sphingomonas nostoxanthinifaciens]UAK26273.1 hypothetical protein K8P63_09385 [Sphingomonas nostoxanthinifaciens]